MFMFWKVNMYSAPIRVGSLPPWIVEVVVEDDLAPGDRQGRRTGLLALAGVDYRYGTPSVGSE